MDDVTYHRCLKHLEDAEQCMVEGVDGWHLARLSHVIESLREAYERPASPTCAPSDRMQ